MTIKKVAVYTALVGKYDHLRPVPEGMNNIDFICFTDGSVSERYCNLKGWIIKKLPEGVNSSRASCRQLKSMPHLFLNDYDVSVWLDSNISFNSSIVYLVDEFNSSDALIRGFRHPARVCAYSEANECINQGKDSEDNIGSMVAYMRSFEYPENQGLTETNVLFRKHHHKSVQAVDEDWSDFLKKFTIRDQISFDFLCWRHRIKVWYFDGTTHRNGHMVFSRGLHRSNNRLKDIFAYIESFQGVYPWLRKIIDPFYRFFG